LIKYGGVWDFDVNEFELIERLSRDLPGHPGVVVGAGDDCAVLDLGREGEWVLFKTDAVVEGVHFRREDLAEKVGHKALGRVLSDIAAMGGRPWAALVTLGLPREFEVEYVEGIYAGLNRLARRWQVGVVGGETTTVPERVVISVSMIGTVSREKCLRRTGSRVGDAIFVTGELGGSLEGRHLEFEPRLEEARWLADRYEVHAMIDLSDGLAGDLRHLLEPAGLGAELLAEAIPVSRAARRRAAAGAAAPTGLVAALTDGEDFELLFTVPSGQAVPLLDGWRERFPGLGLACVGKVRDEPGLMRRDRAGVKPITIHGYAHFA